MFKVAITCSMLAFAPISAMAQDEDADISHGAELLSEGMGIILRGLMDELEPAAEGWAKLMEMVQDFSAYEMPEMLPNGDIIIRRSEPIASEPDGEIDL